MENPYQSPLADTFALPVDEPLREYGGIGRLAYVGYSLLVGIGSGLVAGVAEASEIEILALVAIIASFVLSIMITTLRLKNMGYRPWWVIMLFIPLVNLLVGLRCLICPAGYADTKKLDTAGKVMTGILVGLFLLFVVAALLPLAMGTG